MRPFDAHVHVGHWTLPDFAGHGSTFEEAVRVYQRWNWAGFLAVPTDTADSARLLEKVRAYRGPLEIHVGYWARPSDLSNLERFRKNHTGYSALKLHPSLERIPTNDPQFEPYLKIAAANALPVVIHCGRWQEMAGYELALDVAEHHTDAPVILAHMGGDSPYLVRSTVDAVLDRKLDNAYLGTESIREPWLLEYAVEKLGATRLVFGSDYNLNHPEPFRRLIEVLDLTDEQRTRILRKNIESLLLAAR